MKKYAETRAPFRAVKSSGYWAASNFDGADEQYPELVEGYGAGKYDRLARCGGLRYP